MVGAMGLPDMSHLSIEQACGLRGELRPRTGLKPRDPQISKKWLLHQTTIAPLSPAEPNEGTHRGTLPLGVTAQPHAPTWGRGTLRGLYPYELTPPTFKRAVTGSPLCQDTAAVPHRLKVLKWVGAKAAG